MNIKTWQERMASNPVDFDSAADADKAEKRSMQEEIGELRAALKAQADNPEFDGIENANPAWWRGHWHSAEMFCQKVNEILDGKDDGSGVGNPPWEPTRRRLLELKAQPVQPTKDQEQAAFEAWLTRTCPSGDVTEVHNQWEDSWDYRELFEAQPVQPAPLTISPLEEQQLFDDWCPYKGNPDPRVVWAAAVDAVNGVLLGVRTGGAG